MSDLNAIYDKLSNYAIRRMQEQGIDFRKASPDEVRGGIAASLQPLKDALRPDVYQRLYDRVEAEVLASRDMPAESAFDPVSDTIIAAATGGLGAAKTLAKAGIEGFGKQVLRTAISSGLASVPTSFISGLTGEALRDAGYGAWADVAEIGTAVGIGLGVEHRLARRIDDMIGASVRTFSGFKNLAERVKASEEAVEDIVKRPSLEEPLEEVPTPKLQAPEPEARVEGEKPMLKNLTQKQAKPPKEVPKGLIKPPEELRPLVYEALQAYKVKPTALDTFTPREIKLTEHYIYKEKLLCGIPKEEADKYIKAVEQLEGLKEEIKVPSYDLSDGYIEKYAENLARSKKEQELLVNVMKSLKRSPNFKLTISKKMSTDGFYDFFRNIVRLRDRDPYVFLHELGHWAWNNVLTGKQRVAFLKAVFSQYNSPKDWLRLSAFHSRDFLKSLDFYGKEVDKWLRSPTELFGNMFWEYIMTGHLRDDTFLSSMESANKVMRAMLEKLRGKGIEPHPLAKQFISRLFRHVEPPANFEYGARTDDIEKHWLFVSREDFDKLFTGKFDESDVLASQLLRQLIDTEDVHLGDLLTGEVPIDLEKVIDKVHMEALKLYHGYGSEYGWEDLRLAVDRINQLFAPDPESEARLRAILRREYTASVKGHGRKPVDKTSLDPYTGKPVEELHESERPKYYRAMRDADIEEVRIGQLRDKYRQYVNDLGNLINEMQLRQVDSFPLVMPSRSTNAWTKYQDLYEAEHMDVMDVADRVSLDTVNEWMGSSFIGDEMAAKAVRLRLLPQAIALATGIEFDSEEGVPLPFLNGLRVNWNPEKYLKYGAWLSLYSTNPKGIRKLLTSAFKKAMAKSGVLDSRLVDYLDTIKNSDFVKAFHPTEGLPKEIWKMKLDMERQRVHLRARIAKFAKDINKRFTPEEQRLIAEYIERTGRLDVENVDGRIVKQAEEVKSLIADVREMLKTVGFPEEYLNKLDDRYLMRVYSRYGRVKMKFKGDWELRRLWKGIGADYLRPRGLTKKIKTSSLEYETLAGFDVKKSKKVYSTLATAGEGRQFVHEDNKAVVSMLKKNGLVEHEWEIDHVGKGYIMLRRDFTTAERDSLGEVVEVVPRLVEFAKKVSNDLALANTFKRLLNTEYVVDLGKTKNAEAALLKLKEEGVVPNDWVLVPDVELIPGSGIKKYGELSGKAIHPDVMTLLKTMTDEKAWRLRRNLLVRSWMKFLRHWKVGVTAFNPKTHVFNFMANAHLCVIDGRNPIEVIAKGVEHIKGKTDVFQKAIDAGLLDSNILRGELDLDTFLREIEKVDDATSFKGMFKMLRTYLELPARVGRKGARKIMRLYELGDEVYKMGVIVQEMEKGKSIEDALEAANRLFFDYRDIPKGVRFLRDWGIVPFASYAYKITPVIAKAAIEHPHRLLGILLFYQMIDDLMFAESYGGEKERGKAFERRIRPDYLNYRMYGLGPTNAIRIGSGKDEGGYYAKYLNVANLLPGADILTPNGIFGNYPFGFNPLVSIVYGITTGRDPRFDREFATTWDEAKATGNYKRYFDERMKFIQQQLMPNIPVPGMWSYDKIGNALTAQGLLPKEFAESQGWTGKNYFGGTYSLPEELLGMFGFKTYRVYLDQEFMRKLGKLSGFAKKERMKFHRMIKDPRTSNFELENEVKRYGSVLEAMARKQEELAGMYVKPRE